MTTASKLAVVTIKQSAWGWSVVMDGNEVALYHTRKEARQLAAELETRKMVKSLPKRV